MLREALKSGAPQGVKAKSYMDKGELVPDALVIELVAERLSQPDARRGFILDGFPRTADQAVSLDQTLQALKMPLDFVLYFKTTLPVIIRRLGGRRVCSQCNKNYHMTNFRPKVEGICDACGAKLVQRPDDREDTISNRLQVYDKQTAPLIEYYKKKKVLTEVDGDLEVAPLNRVLTELFASKGFAASGNGRN